MKKQLFGLMTILTILNACQKNEVSVSLLEEVTIHATIEDKDATKTIMDENNNILWSENDQIIAFMKSSYGYKYQVKPSFVGKSYADFSMVSSNNGSDLSAGNEWEHNVVYYPYAEDIECLKSGANYALEVNLPAEQTYVPDSFANGSMAMVAVSESNNITFKNVLGGIKLQLKGTQEVASIKIEGKNNEKLAGAATVIAYTDETKPAITMTSSESTSVTLNCGEGVQLNESTATAFIIALPPVLFSKGFVVTLFDTEDNVTTLETDKANTILRSSLLSMPIVNLSSDSDDETEEDITIPVSTVSLTYTSLKLYVGGYAQLSATVKPNDATNKNVVWSTNDASIATVDQTGQIVAISKGVATISAIAGGVESKCSVHVVAPTEYVDEFGENHGKGIAIGMSIWAPVNCGYHKSNYPYGKLYQWGRKYGQGYNGPIEINGRDEGTYADAVDPIIENGGISTTTGNHKNNANIFYTGDEYRDWAYPHDKKLWNSGTEQNPIKTEVDPCPIGWRVPTKQELEQLTKHRSNWTANKEGQYGYWFCGEITYTSEVPQAFFPALGSRNYDGVCKSVSGGPYARGEGGNYWTSSANGNYSYNLTFHGYNYVQILYGDSTGRGYGFGVRCVQE